MGMDSARPSGRDRKRARYEDELTGVGRRRQLGNGGRVLDDINLHVDRLVTDVAFLLVVVLYINLDGGRGGVVDRSGRGVDGGRVGGVSVIAVDAVNQGVFVVSAVEMDAVCVRRVEHGRGAGAADA